MSKFTRQDALPTTRESRRSVLPGVAGPLLGLLLVVAFFAVAEFGAGLVRGLGQGTELHEYVSEYRPRFLTVANARTILVQTCTVAMAALGMTIIIMAGGIDLSAGCNLALAATVLAQRLDSGQSIGLALVAAVTVASLAGALNGILISALRLTPFIITLGTMTFYLGLAKLLAGETTIRPPLQQIPGWVGALVSPRPRPPWLLMPLAAWLTLTAALVMAALVKFTVLGRHVRAVGNNEQTAVLCGIRVGRLKITVYTLAGALIGCAGILQFARLATGNPVSGIGLELRMIAAVVIGGGSLSGGRGSMFGTILGAGITATIANGCTMLELRNPLQDMVLGIIIVAAVLIDHVRSRRTKW